MKEFKMPTPKPLFVVTLEEEFGYGHIGVDSPRTFISWFRASDTLDAHSKIEEYINLQKEKAERGIGCSSYEVQIISLVNAQWEIDNVGRLDGVIKRQKLQLEKGAFYV